MIISYDTILKKCLLLRVTHILKLSKASLRPPGAPDALSIELMLKKKKQRKAKSFAIFLIQCDLGFKANMIAKILNNSNENLLINCAQCVSL